MIYPVGHAVVVQLARSSFNVMLYLMREEPDNDVDKSFLTLINPPPPRELLVFSLKLK